MQLTLLCRGGKVRKIYALLENQTWSYTAVVSRAFGDETAQKMGQPPD
jgi:hypothetical protein